MQIRHYQKTTLMSILGIVLILAACSPTELPGTEILGTVESLTPKAVLEVVSQLSQDMSISVSDIQIVDFEQVDWPDACLGVTQEEQVCAQVVTPGFRVVLEVNGEQYEFHSNEDGTVIIQAAPMQ